MTGKNAERFGVSKALMGWKAINGQPLDLTADPQKATDFAVKHPDVRDRFVAESKRWAESVGITSDKPAPGE